MDKDKGYKLIFTCGRPSLTALDIATWDVIFQIGGKVVKEVSFPVDQEAMEFKVLKNVKEIQLAIAFTDRDGNQSDYTWSDVFDSQDNIAPAMPGAVSFTMREESEDDGDIFEIAEAVEPDDDESESNEPVDGDEESDDYGEQEEPIEGELDNKDYDNDDEPIDGEIVDDGGDDAVDGNEGKEEDESIDGEVIVDEDESADSEPSDEPEGEPEA